MDERVPAEQRGTLMLGLVAHTFAYLLLTAAQVAWCAITAVGVWGRRGAGGGGGPRGRGDPRPPGAGGAAAACCCTAAASICQRIGAKSSATAGFNIGLVFRLARRPVWLLGIASMIAGFILQLAALRFGALGLVQPILAAELVVVFGYLA